MSSPSQVPVRYPSGVSTDYPWGPLANYGLPNPFFYHSVYSDFDTSLAKESEFTQQVTTGTSAALANVAGDGGQWEFTTGTAANNATSIEVATANFVLPPATYTGTGLTATDYPAKKVFFLTRVNVTNVAQVGVIAGLVNQAAAPVVGITDGIYINISGAATANMYAYSASTLLWTVAIPPAVLAAYYANANWLDIGFYMDRLQNVYAFMGYPLVGWLPASAWSGVNPGATPTPKAAVAAYQTGVSGAWTPTTANLTPCLMAYSIGAASNTMYADFCFAAKER